jgi:hypothetical protein
MTAAIADSAEDMKRAFERLSLPAHVVHVGGRDEVLAAMREASGAPAVVVYMGHGALLSGDLKPPGTAGGRLPSPLTFLRSCPETGERCLSVACVGNSPLAIEEMVEAVPENAPPVILLADACTSAHVDLRRVNPRSQVAVLSMTPAAIRMLVSGKTIATRAIEDLAAQPLDADCDGIIDDLELFDGLNRVATQGSVTGAQPKYRRALDNRVPIVRSDRRSGCTPLLHSTHAPTSLTVSQEVDGSFLVRGRFGAASTLSWAGAELQPRDLVPLPCLGAVGQCFRLRGAPAR